MGYTHYWKHSTIDKMTWDSILIAAEELIRHSPVELRFDYDIDEPAQCDEECIRFNGVGDNGHETFLLTREMQLFEFCKTARKPYDLIVCAILAVAAEQAFQIEVVSDGDFDDDEWVDALAYASRILGRPIVLPFKSEATT